MSPATKQAEDTKPFHETGTEYLVTDLKPGALPQPFFEQARSEHGLEVWSGIAHQFSENNSGGKGNSVTFEALFLVAPSQEAPAGVLIYAMKYEVVANGDRFVMAGTFAPKGDGTYLADLWFEPALGTGRFAGATGTITDLTPIPNGYVMNGTITTVGATK